MSKADTRRSYQGVDHFFLQIIIIIRIIIVRVSGITCEYTI